MDMGVGASKLPQAKAGIVVTLDALGTLYKFREPITTQYIKVAGRCGLTSKVEEADLKKAFKKSFKDITAEYPNYGKGQLSSPRAWWKTVVNDAFRQVVSEKDIPDHLGDELYDHFTSSAAYELYPDVKPFFSSMRELKQQYSKPDDPPVFVGVISNSDPRVKRILQSLGLRVGFERVPRMESVRERAERASSDLPTIMQSVWHNAYEPLNDIDFLATSYEASSEKPDAGLFKFAVTLANMNFVARLEQQRADWSPTWDAFRAKMSIASQVDVFQKSQFIHIGDDYDKDYEGALSNGFEAMHLVREGDGIEAKSGASIVTDLYQAAAAIRIIAQSSLGKSDN